MADTNLLILAREFKNLRTKVQEILKMPVGPQGLQGEKGEQGVKGDIGAPGKNGKDGKDGSKGLDGLNGKDGIDGIDGKDGVDGISVVDARVDFDGSLVLTLSNGTEIDAGKVSSEQVENVYAMLKNGAASLNELLPTQEGNANKYLKTDGVNTSWDTLDGSDINLASPPVIGNVIPNAGTFTTLTATGQTSLGGVAGSESLRVVTPSSAPNAYVKVFGSPFGFGYITTDGSAASSGLLLSSKGGASASIYTNNFSQEQLRVPHTTSAVNYVQVTGAATGARPTISAQGSDSAVDLNFAAKGIGGIYFQQFSVFGSGKFNNWTTDGAATGLSPFFRAGGGDTNVSATFGAKGTGAINLAPGSSGVNISNGGTVTALTRTNGGSGYTSAPSVVIAAPTTAGGVQATATATISTTGTPTIVSGGTGYTVGNVLTIVGGTPVSFAATMTVTAVSGGVITAASYTNFAQYTVAPTGTISVTGGTGAGATFNISFGVTAAFTITNAGSGYVEQPTVTFSGGGGSGASAYATVGSGTVVRSVGPTFSFHSPSGEILRLGNTTFAANSANYVSMLGGPAGNPPWVLSQGADTNVDLVLQTKGTGNIVLGTGQNFTQARVAHTASAVNYVQVTGGATGSPGIVTISSQGSDANTSLIFTNKGTGAFSWFNGGGTSSRLFRLNGGATNMANHLQIDAAAAGSAPTLSVGSLSSDTNVDLALTPKGTGNVRFGTYTGTALSIAGYIEIKDSGGTVRKLAVVA
jgi:hypothetical protein